MLCTLEYLLAIFGYRNALIHTERVFMPGIDKLLDVSCTLANDDILKRFDKQAAGFVDFVENLREKKLC
ncbi:MAG: hypothetical protein QM813_11185 [Verrucomicrobiota bacterium]